MTALPFVDFQDNASESKAAMEDEDGLVHDGSKKDHQPTTEEDGGAASGDRADSDSKANLRIMNLIPAFHCQRIAARLAQQEQCSQAREDSSSTRHRRGASRSEPSTTSVVKDVIKRAQRADKI